jgi:hypothetical protein
MALKKHLTPFLARICWLSGQRHLSVIHRKTPCCSAKCGADGSDAARPMPRLFKRPVRLSNQVFNTFNKPAECNRESP